MEPPVTIPNTVVKHLEAESTCMETCWEDRKLPVVEEGTDKSVPFFYKFILQFDKYMTLVNYAEI